MLCDVERGDRPRKGLRVMEEKGGASSKPVADELQCDGGIFG